MSFMADTGFGGTALCAFQDRLREAKAESVEERGTALQNEVAEGESAWAWGPRKAPAARECAR
jgi:hypothetical protein